MCLARIARASHASSAPETGIAGSRHLNTSKQRKDEILKESFGSTRKRPRSNMYGLVYNFRAMLNATGCYDEPEVSA